MLDYYIPLEDRTVIAISGDDVRPFLQGIISNDIRKVGPACAIYTLLLTPQGKFLFDFFIVENEGGFLLDCDAARAPELLKRFVMYKLRSKVEITAAGNNWSVAALTGASALEKLGLPAEPGAATAHGGGIIYVDPRDERMGARAILPRSAVETIFPGKLFTRGNHDDYERLRIALGVPDGARDLVPEKSFPLHYDMERFHAIDFSKGCYVGQEVTARSKHRGVIRKGIVRVEGEETLPECGAAIMLDGKEIGEMRSSLGRAGLAILDLEAVERSCESGSQPRARDIALKLL